MEWRASKEIQETKLSRLVEFWRKKETEESVKLLRFLEWSLDSWGLNSLRCGTQRKSRIWGTENEFKCMWHVQVAMSSKQLDVWVWKLRRDQACDKTWESPV